MARMTYTDAFNALEYLDSIGVTGGEAFEEAVQEIADSLGDQDFMEKIQYGVLGDKQRAREFDYSLEEQRALEAKKKKQAQNQLQRRPRMQRKLATYMVLGQLLKQNGIKSAICMVLQKTHRGNYGKKSYGIKTHRYIVCEIIAIFGFPLLL